MLTKQESNQALQSKRRWEPIGMEMVQKFYLSGIEMILDKAMSDQIEKRSNSVSLSLDSTAVRYKKSIEKILQGGGFENVEVEEKYESHDRYVESWLEVKFTF